MQLISKAINYSGNTDFKLIPLGDIHIGPNHCDRATFRAKVAEIKEDPNAMWIGMGDYLDCIELSDTKRSDPTVLEDEFNRPEVIGKCTQTQRDSFVKDVECIKDKCLGLISGNHEAAIYKYHHYDVMSDICKSLGVPNLSDMALIRLTFRQEFNGGVLAWNLTICACHGAGGGRRPGAKINRLEDLMTSFDSDIYLMGHNHSTAIMPPIIVPGISQRGKPALVETVKYGFLTGTYLKTYIPESSGYGQRNLYRPSKVGGVDILINPVNKTVSGVL